jgi:hypothetical protein
MASDTLSIGTVLALVAIWVADKTVGELMAIYFQRAWFEWMDTLDQRAEATRLEVRTQRDRFYGHVRRHRHMAKHFRLLATVCVVGVGIVVWSCATLAGLPKATAGEPSRAVGHPPHKPPAGQHPVSGAKA